jgi:hypothetical protein
MGKHQKTGKHRINKYISVHIKTTKIKIKDLKNLHRSIASNKSKTVTKKLTNKKSPGCHGFTVEV